ncbi:MAG TPA: hypothetical protein VN426_16650 [Syntrophomonadaceae bacterium]|nr:hypothetical protein [Syntrophomonadaceae bacterium]
MDKSFNLQFVGQEKHLVLPTITSIVLVQNLYDALFQYVLTPEQEGPLEAFIKKLETHIKKKQHAPFSIPVEELAFLGEGLEELRMLNWMEIPLCKFAILLNPDQEWTPELQEQEFQDIMENLEDYAIISRIEDSPYIYLYPYRITPL